jgi:hypothetical protein
MNAVIIDGKRVAIGDTVCFKSDYEQSGELVKISTNSMGNTVLKLYNEDEFGGDYIGGQEYTTQLLQDCWVE